MKGTGHDHVASARAAAAEGGSAIGAYMDLVVGARSWPRLLQHEVLGCWLAGTPGALGLALRRVLWRRLFHASGRGVIWGRNVGLRHSRKMDIGDAVVVDDDCQLDAQGCVEGGFSIGAGALISRGCIVSGKDGALTIGPRVNIGAGCILYASTELKLVPIPCWQRCVLSGAAATRRVGARIYPSRPSRYRGSASSSRKTAGWGRVSLSSMVCASVGQRDRGGCGCHGGCCALFGGCRCARTARRNPFRSTQFRG
jgi:hypothetical protein